MESLNDAQKRATLHVNGPLLILAGAGTGKTKTLTHRLAHMLEIGISPHNILLLTFTNKAADEMVSRAEKMLGDSYNMKALTACTYHGFCLRMLKQYGESIDLPLSFSIADSPTSKDILKKLRDEMGEENGYAPGLIENVISLSVNLQESIPVILKRFHPEVADDVSFFTEIRDAYVEYKEDHHILDYDDLLVRMVDLLTHKEICEKLSRRYTYIMVDEYQDSNKLQFQILSQLCMTHENLCVVGDDSQSIYGWRGADHKNILRFPKQFPKCETVILDTNYRSQQAILDVANEVVELMEEKFEKHLHSNIPASSKPLLCQSFHSQSQAEQCFAVIQQKRLRGVPNNEICVLARNSRSLNLIELELKKHKLDYVKYGGLKFLDKAHVRDFLSYLKAFVNPADEIAWVRILCLIPGCGTKSAVQIYDKIQTDGLEGMKDKKFARRKYGEDLGRLCQLFQDLPSHSLKEQIQDIFTYLSELYPNVKGYKRDWRKRIRELEVLDTMANNYKKASSFLEDMLMNGTEEPDATGKLVLSTIHSAKGLEYDTVLLVDCMEGILPSYDSDTLEEDKRLFYVAITRAKSSLYFFCPQFNTQGKPIRVSSFLTNKQVRKTIEERVEY